MTHTQHSSIEKNKTLSSDLRLLAPSCITSNRKLKSVITGHATMGYIYTYSLQHILFTIQARVVRSGAWLHLLNILFLVLKVSDRYVSL